MTNLDTPIGHSWDDHRHTLRAVAVVYCSSTWRGLYSEETSWSQGRLVDKGESVRSSCWGDVFQCIFVDLVCVLWEGVNDAVSRLGFAFKVQRYCVCLHRKRYNTSKPSPPGCRRFVPARSDEPKSDFFTCFFRYTVHTHTVSFFNLSVRFAITVQLHLIATREVETQTLLALETTFCYN